MEPSKERAKAEEWNNSSGGRKWLSFCDCGFPSALGQKPCLCPWLSAKKRCYVKVIIRIELEACAHRLFGHARPQQFRERGSRKCFLERVFITVSNIGIVENCVRDNDLLRLMTFPSVPLITVWNTAKRFEFLSFGSVSCEIWGVAGIMRSSTEMEERSVLCFFKHLINGNTDSIVLPSFWLDDYVLRRLHGWNIS